MLSCGKCHFLIETSIDQTNICFPAVQWALKIKPPSETGASSELLDSTMIKFLKTARVRDGAAQPESSRRAQIDVVLIL